MSALQPRDAADAASERVATIRYSGNPEQDHLLDEIQHPETTDALYELAARPGTAGPNGGGPATRQGL
ncbi:hypothetical protein [Kitasatospora sp. DSM 101779]|uniref:hypothetical protein n=1 Tax=Kitasatospora sp. DSM 101779 TaxID=2853165 RepID=UPI0021DB47F0|nr:hypothetical protein [Kitasatospora sp. DSM 101779]MCU7826211.1 hypothetical protein [Kitasatospora sp. DSM 101779]